MKTIGTAFGSPIVRNLDWSIDCGSPHPVAGASVDVTIAVDRTTVDDDIAVETTLAETELVGTSVEAGALAARSGGSVSSPHDASRVAITSSSDHFRRRRTIEPPMLDSTLAVAVFVPSIQLAVHYLTVSSCVRT
jgi:hypothetical protein